MIMILNDFIHILSDAIQQHEGWLEGTGQAWPNLNPGNLHMEGQEGASGETGAEAKFASFFDGKQALNKDIAAKIAGGKNTIRSIIEAYESGDSSNNVPAYITEVIAFFHGRNVNITAETVVPDELENLNTPIVLVAINQIFDPADWAAIQASIAQCARYMPAYSFSTRYSNADLKPFIASVEQAVPESTYTGISATGVNETLTPYNQGQVLNVLIYNGTIMQGQKNPFGGCEYAGSGIRKTAPISAMASVMYQGPAFNDSTARVLFHELIHELFSVTEQADVLHPYLISHGGYQADLAVDLEAVFVGNQLNTPAAVANLEAEKKSI